MSVHLLGTTITSNGWKKELRDYARWEYGRDAEYWLGTLQSQVRRPSRLRAWVRRVLQSDPGTARPDPTEPDLS